ncbi:hypothetical protein G7050_12735 [Dysgonomonas sp. HDW5A]|uniref:hypothetical protein n=1 Tax=Dysgonomonas sp. HDW5A TaxID=2714926 RepID=UPI00140A32A4|nr:hypothetical protein [Dysgonomonas sp. HDW5A]QIK60649.1 hypothetical protein G7050_12735 [Dysgonomonas sp. HDW5A]
MEKILQKLYSSKEFSEVLMLRQKVEIIAAKLEYLTSIEPQTDEDYENLPSIIEYVKQAIELNIEIAAIYTLDVWE